MGNSGKKEGRCHICGRNRELTFEHCPPRGSGLNPLNVRDFDGADFLRDIHGEKMVGHKSPRGYGGYTLCDECNNKSGSWYAKEFNLWAAQIYRIIRLSGGRSEFAQLRGVGVHPLRFLKQCVVMLMCHLPVSFIDDHEVLRTFVLNRESRKFISQFGFWLASIPGGPCGTTGLTHWMDISGKTAILAEYSFPPFVILMIESAYNCSPLSNMRKLLTFGYSDRVTYNMVLPIVHKKQRPYPGIYEEFNVLPSN